MKNHFAALLLHVFFILLINNVRAQTNVADNNAAVSLASNAIFFVPGIVQISGAANILNNGNFYVGGDFTNNGGGLKAAGTGTVIFNGSANQNINGTNSVVFYDVIKSANNSVIIALDETINNKLTLLIIKLITPIHIMKRMHP